VSCVKLLPCRCAVPLTRVTRVECVQEEADNFHVTEHELLSLRQEIEKLRDEKEQVLRVRVANKVIEAPAK